MKAGPFVRKMGRQISTIAIRLGLLSASNRWKLDASYKKSWNERTILMSRFIPQGTSVIEFGAARKVLLGYLPAGCSYTPSDLVYRGPGTIVLNLNKDSLASVPKHDIAFFSGVLEYIRDLSRLSAEIAQVADTVITSYAIYKAGDSIPKRRAAGWVNDYSIDSIKQIFHEAGFIHQEIAGFWKEQVIFIFKKF